MVAVTSQHILVTEGAEDEALPREQAMAFMADSVSLGADLSC